MFDTLVDLNKLKVRGPCAVENVACEVEGALSSFKSLRNLLQVTGQQNLRGLGGKE